MTNNGMKIYISIEQMENEGCNNGNYPRIFSRDTGKVIGNTCRCGNGCSNTTKVYLDDSGFYIIK